MPVNSTAAVCFYHLLGTRLLHCGPGQTEKRPSIVTLFASPAGVIQQKYMRPLQTLYSLSADFGNDEVLLEFVGHLDAE